MIVEVLAATAAVAEAGAAFIADCARSAVETRGVFPLAGSCDQTPWVMLMRTGVTRDPC
jgi:hypothetical protein